MISPVPMQDNGSLGDTSTNHRESSLSPKNFVKTCREKGSDCADVNESDLHLVEFVFFVAFFVRGYGRMKELQPRISGMNTKVKKIGSGPFAFSRKPKRCRTPLG